MLTEKRYELILELLDKKRSVTVPEIKDVLEFRNRRSGGI